VDTISIYWNTAERGDRTLTARVEARDERRLVRLQKQMVNYKLLIIPCPAAHAYMRERGRTRLRPAQQNRRRTVVRADLATLRTRRHADHQQSIRAVFEDIYRPLFHRYTPTLSGPEKGWYFRRRGILIGS
jgi:hypothetical protein